MNVITKIIKIITLQMINKTERMRPSSPSSIF